MDNLRLQSTSRNSAKVIDPLVIDGNDITRRIFIADINDTKTATKETVGGVILHQRKNKKGIWEDVKSITLSSLKAGEGVKLDFSSKQLRKLYEHLNILYALSEQGIKSGKTEYVVGKSDEIIKVPKDRREFIKRLIEENHGEEVWRELTANDPDLATRLSLARIQGERKKALEEFKYSIEEDKNESYWQAFFTNNDWIFGYGLKYCFLNLITDQPYYGGTNVKGKGAQKGDFLMGNSGDIKYTVLVEIKKPLSALTAKKKDGKDVVYRNGVNLLSSELLGGVSQVQVNCNTWMKESLNSANKDLEGEKIYTVSPKAILVIGHTSQLNTKEKVETFEAFRRNIFNPEIITFDELYQRARFIVEHESSIVQTGVLHDEDDLPF